MKNPSTISIVSRRSKKNTNQKRYNYNPSRRLRRLSLLALYTKLVLQVLLLIILLSSVSITQVECRSSTTVDHTEGSTTVVLPTTTTTTVDEATELVSNDGWNKAFQEIKQSTEALYSNVPLNTKEIALKSDKNNVLDTFFDKILSNEAPYSIQRYMETIVGDTEMTTSKWSLSNDGKQHSRKITYIHPVSNPLAPPTAKAIKTQILKRYGNVGMTLDTTTEVIGVPKTDCFVVEDRLLIESSSGNRVKVTARFDLRFIKRTMFKSIITSQTTKEFNDWFQGFGTYLQQIDKKPVGNNDDNNSIASTVSMSSSSSDEL